MAEGEPVTLAYAIEPPPASRMWAAAVLLFAAVALVVLGGCFLVGVMLLSTNGFTNSPLIWAPRHYLLAAVLYLLAFTCFASAGVILVRTVARLLKLMKS